MATCVVTRTIDSHNWKNVTDTPIRLMITAATDGIEGALQSIAKSGNHWTCWRLPLDILLGVGPPLLAFSPSTQPWLYSSGLSTMRRENGVVCK